MIYNNNKDGMLTFLKTIFPDFSQTFPDFWTNLSYL